MASALPPTGEGNGDRLLAARDADRQLRRRRLRRRAFWMGALRVPLMAVLVLLVCLTLCILFFGGPRMNPPSDEIDWPTVIQAGIVGTVAYGFYRLRHGLHDRLALLRAQLADEEVRGELEGG